MSATPIAASPAPPGMRVLDPATVTRTEVVRPSMCGHNSLFVGQLGDWTWDAVSTLCGTDVLRARDASGAPTYLSFYYWRIMASRRFHLRSPTFGDRLQATTRLFDFGGESVLALHRVARAQAEPDDALLDGFAPDAFYGPDGGDVLRVESFNRWVSRSDARSNEALVRSAPTDFRHRHLPTPPEAHSPRLATYRARTDLTFRDPDAEYRAEGPELSLDYEIDPSRDLNGVGLLYFASYFSIVDWALWRLWRRLGRSDRSFLERVVVDQQMCCLGNANPGCAVTASLRRWRVVGDDGREVVDAVLRDRKTGRVLAVCTLDLLAGASA